MKKSIIALIVASVIAIPTVATAGLKDSLLTAGWGTVDPTVKYKMDTYGYNVRIYEWAPKDNKDVRCVFVAGNTNSTGVACYNVKK